MVNEYNRRVGYDLVKGETDFIREVAIVRLVVDGDKVYLQSDPIDFGDGGDLVVKRLAELDMVDAVSILYRAIK